MLVVAAGRHDGSRARAADRGAAARCARPTGRRCTVAERLAPAGPPRSSRCWPPAPAGVGTPRPLAAARRCATPVPTVGVCGAPATEELFGFTAGRRRLPPGRHLARAGAGGRRAAPCSQLRRGPRRRRPRARPRAARRAGRRGRPPARRRPRPAAGPHPAQRPPGGRRPAAQRLLQAAGAADHPRRRPGARRLQRPRRQRPPARRPRRPRRRRRSAPPLPAGAAQPGRGARRARPRRRAGRWSSPSAGCTRRRATTSCSTPSRGWAADARLTGARWSRSPATGRCRTSSPPGSRAERLPVVLLGRRGDVADLLGAADVCVLPSRWEGSPFTAQEALRAGTPLVATRTGGMPELVGEARRPGAGRGRRGARRRRRAGAHRPRARGRAGRGRPPAGGELAGRGGRRGAASSPSTASCSGRREPGPP